LPERAFRYAIPRSAPDEVRRYGFHGLSHQYLVERYAELTGSAKPTLVTLHLGGGASAAAVSAGVSIDTSMGMSPLEGLVMGTRAGDLDPAVVLDLLARAGSVAALEEILNEGSGLQALAGDSDMRVLLARDDPEARLAVEIFCYRARKYVGAYLAALGGAEAIVFSGGIGENSPEIRRRIAGRLEWFGLELDEALNRAGAGRISTARSRLHAYVIPTDEELLMARQALAALED
jgi:acetate kinase